MMYSNLCLNSRETVPLIPNSLGEILFLWGGEGYLSIFAEVLGDFLSENSTKNAGVGINFVGEKPRNFADFYPFVIFLR